MSKQDNTIAQKITKLEAQVAWFDSDEFELEQAIDAFRRAEALASEIERDLDELKNEISVVKQRFDKE